MNKFFWLVFFLAASHSLFGQGAQGQPTQGIYTASFLDLEVGTTTTFSATNLFWCSSGTTCQTSCSGSGWKMEIGQSGAGSYTGTISNPDPYTVQITTPSAPGGAVPFSLTQRLRNMSWTTGFGGVCVPFSGTIAASFPSVEIYTTRVDIASLGSLAQVCTTQAPFDLTNYITVNRGASINNLTGQNIFNCGMTVLGPGVVNGVFNPATAGVGTQTIVVTMPFGSGTKTYNISIVVRPVPVITFNPPAAVCSDGSIINVDNFYSDVNGGATHTFSSTSTGFTLPSFFNPATASIGTNTIVASTTNSYSCGTTSSQTINVVSTYSVNAGSNQQVCSGAAAIALSGASPGGGTWSGTGVSGSNFDPTGLAVGTYTVTYTVNQSGCIKTATKTVQILSLPTVAAGSDLTSCDNAGSVNLATVGVSPSGGTWAFSDPSLNSRINNAALTVNVNGMTAGVYSLIYSYTNASNCTNTASRNLTIVASPAVSAGTNDVTCVNSLNYTLTGFSPAGGTWSGTGIVSGTSVFSPVTAGVGTWTLTYSYTNSVTGCSNSATKNVTVNSLPAVGAGSNFSACVSGGQVALNGTPTGGTWSGSGVTGNNFSPSLAGVGSSNLVYSFTSLNGCTNTAMIIATVNGNPAVSAGTAINACAGDANFSLSGGTPTGGTWSGTGVVGGSFSPIIAGVGTQTLTYSYTNSNGCSGSATTTVTVNPLPIVSAGTNLQACFGGGLVALNDATVSPTGGSWSGSGTTGTNFDPVAAGTGNHIVTYTYTNANGCTATSTRQILVLAPTTVNAGSSLQACVSATSLSLTGQSPLGGTWSGTAVTGSIFNPSVAGVGTFVITYTYIDGNNCPNSATRNIVVNGLPSVSAGGSQVACTSSTSLVLTGATPNNGTWSGPTVVGSTFNPALAGAGSFTVTYSVTDVNGCTGSANKSVTVNILPTVTVGTNFTSCINGANIPLTSGTPAGGTWSGNGVSSGNFNPGVAGPGNSVLTYSYTNGSGCTNTATLSATVNALPTVTAGNDLGTCASVTNLNLTGGTPNGGTWSGPGVTGNTFNATVAGIGTSVVTYTYTDANGCTNSATRNVTVTSSPTVAAGSDQAVCYNTPAFTITGGSPAGGTWSGTGVFNNIFDPTQSGLGTFVVTYTFNNGAGCNGTATKNIQVKSIPGVNAGPNIQACLNAGIQNLTGGTPAGGTWSGTGVSGSTFNPFTAGAGTNVLTYSFTQNGCTNTATTQATVFALPSVSGGPDLSTCVNNNALPLSGASPAGGTWTGTGVSGNNFNAVTAGIGTFVVTYNYTDGNSCTVSSSRNVVVNGLPSVNAGSNFSVCINSAPVTLSGFSPTGGTWTGAGISGGNFSPSLAGVGIFTLTYTYSNGNGCSVSSTRQVTVYSLPTVTVGSSLSMCANAGITNLTGGTPSGGTWSGSGVVGSSFIPGSVGAGVYSALYSVTDANSCTNTASLQIVVNSIPTVTPGPDLTICQNGTANLTGATPVGGTWSGVGVTGNTFSGAVSGVGLQVVTYSYTGGNGCSNSATRNITVHPVPVVTGGGALIVCSNTPAFTITGGSPINGTWSGSGVNNNSFSPSIAGLGPTTVTYSYSDVNGCTSTATKNITVTALPAVSAGPDISVCANVAPFTLTGASPSGGTWSGTGISGSTFNALAAGVGSFNATYSYTDLNGCSANSSRTLTVNALPTVSAGPDLNTCFGNVSALTGGSPAGGVWSGSGVSGSSFDASAAGVGVQIVSYTYTSAQGCGVTATRQIQVNALPVVGGGSNLQICKNQNVTLTDGTPIGGTWTGTGVSGNSFNANFVSIGIQTITYSFTTAAGCTASATKQITVNSLPVVTSGADLTLCQNAGVIPLTGATPTGGTWSGSGIAGNNFNTANVGIGAYVLTYTYTDGNGCSAASSRNVIVNQVPTVTVGSDLNKCLGDVFTLSGASPTGGVWSGSGVIGNSFNTMAAGVGTQVVTYTYTNLSGCSASANQNIIVNALPVVNAGSNLSTCLNQNIALVDGTPVNGVWSGPGVSINVFNPVQTGIGTQTLTYTYTNPANGCSASKSRTITVNGLPTVTAGPDLTTCQGSSPISLSGASPSGGTWTGAGISGNTFNPLSSGSFSATYSYTDANGCSAISSRNITVNVTPTVSAGTDLNKCLGDVFSLSGASPNGGTWSGSGVTGSSFTTTVVGVGTTTVTYTFTSNGCSNSATRNIVVNALPTVSAGIDLTTCLNQNITLNDGIPTGGTWSGPAVTGNIFNSSLAGTGVQTLTYSYTNSVTGCTNISTRKIAVNGLPTVSAGPGLTLCANSGVTFLTGASPAGGTWSGTGVTAGAFNPSVAGVGVQVVTYSYTDVNGCTQSSTAAVIVNSLPTVSAGPDQSVCQGQVITLTGGTPSGGIWSGVGVTGAQKNQFDSNIAGVGPQSLSYAFTNASGCTSASSRTITVNAIPLVQAGTGLTLCLSSPATALTGGSPAGGVWSGPGISGTSFNPSSVGLGTQTITYSYSSNGCTGTSTTTVNVVNNPTVSAGSDLSSCINSGTVALTGASPAGGSWSGPGVSGNNFNPAIAGVGTSVVTYTYTQGAGCSGTATRQVNVHNIPTVSAGSDTQVCIGQSLTLTGATPSGGTWSGTGVNGNIFTASGIGSQVVTYSYTDVNGCNNAANINITVNALPVVLGGTDQTTCVNGGLLTLTDGSPTGGIWTGTGVSNGKLDPSISGVGTVQVSYTYVNTNGCSNVAKKNVNVQSVPMVNAGSNSTVCVNSPIMILSGATPVGGAWTGPGVSGTTFNPTLAGIGNQVLTYTYTGSNGCSGTGTIQILVNNAPNVTAGSALTVCSSQTNVNLTSGSPVGGTWSGSGVNGSTFNATQAAIGNNYLTYTYSGANGCSASALLQVTVNAGPTVSGLSNTETCFGGTAIPLSDGTPSGGTWSGPGVSSGQFRPQNVTIGAHTLTYTYTDPSTGCSGSATAIYTVNSLPVVTTGQAKTFCLSAPPYDMSGDVSPVSGTFSGTGVTSGTTQFNPSAAGLGTYNITYTYSDQNGCSNSAARAFTVISGLPQPTITGPSVVCYGQTGTYTASTPGANAFTVFYWYLQGETSPFASGQSTSVPIIANTTIYADAVNTQGCPAVQRGSMGVTSENLKGTVTASSTSPSTGDPVTFTYSGSAVSTFAWQFGDGGISEDANSAVHFYYEPGNYDVILNVTSPNNCTLNITNKNMITVSGQAWNIITGVEPNDKVGFSLYPNPADDVIHIEIVLDKSQEITARLFSLIGDPIDSKTLTGTTGKNPVDFAASNLPQGVYILQIKSATNTYSTKVIKK